MKLKYIVVCGPAISSDSINDPWYKARLNFPLICSVSYFPEAQYGGDGVTNHVDQIIKRELPTIIYTRYNHTLQAFGNAISDGRVKCDQLSIALHEEVEGEILVTEHTMNSEGFMQDGWPFGILS